MTSKESVLPQHSELRIVLVGKVGAGKTSVMKTLLRSSEENDKPDLESQNMFLPDTEKCQRGKVKIRGRTVVVVDTPGLCSTEKTDEEVMEEVKQCVSLAAPGPHVFLFVLSCLDRFTKEDQDAVDIIKKTFGETVTCYTMALFTHGDELKNNRKTIQEFIEENNDLKNFVTYCNGGSHDIENEDQSPSQVTKLLQEINVMVQKNGGKCYTVEMLVEAEKKGKGSGVWKRITLSVNGSALAGAGLGGAVSHFVGSSVGIPAGVAVGAAVGGVFGAVGIVTAEHIKAKRCVIQ
ncbi:GTPase IMAP family member 9-like [Dicentrarchus labrax]|uniref:GTPase IMAP family member 9-like n=1 Tax=Dicentrarchus labrax TaxID=13489 RepID=UPI0021F66FC1|nr:GTPase IMAP family member 9-like [Dicentrarchus labrax]